MNVHGTTGIRELTAHELDEVTGGITANDPVWEGVVFTAIFTTAIMTGLGALLEWLFG